jgi:hypothetical protein
MPLDAAGKILDPLTKMGITPIPEDVVTKHKADYEEWFSIHYQYVSVVNRNSIGWMTIYYDAEGNITSDLIIQMGLPMIVGLTLRQWLQFPIDGLGNHMDRVETPGDIIDLAERVQEELVKGRIETTFELDYFEKDPVLYVVYSLDGRKHRDCLAIWDQGVILAIAA